MRLIIGIVMGFLLTVAVAYWHDSGGRSVEPGVASEQIVNWDVADRTFRGARETVVRGFNRLTGGHQAAPENDRQKL